MKRALIIVTSIFVALSVTGYAFAVEFDVSGSLRVEGIYNENASSQDTDKADSFRNMRLRVKAEAKVTDKITLVTRFDALDKMLSSNDSAFEESEDDDNIDFDRAYMKIVSPIGLFIVGRMEGITWGTSFADDEDDTDRLTYVLPIPVGDDKLYIAAVLEKVTEVDQGVGASGKDNDKYYLSATYKAENFKAGFLVGFYHFNTFQDPGQAQLTKAVVDAGGADAVQGYVDHSAMALGAGTAAAVRAAGIEAAVIEGATAQTVAAAVTGGMTQAQALDYVATGSVAAGIEAAAAATIAAAIAGDADVATYTALQTAHMGSAAGYAPAYAAYGALTTLPRGTTTEGKVWLISPYFIGKFGALGISTELDYATGTASYDTNNTERDLNAYSFMFETTYDAGPATVQLGFATSTGDSDHTDDDIESMGYISPGVDWEKMFILSSDYHGMNTSLGGGSGNHAGAGFATYSNALIDGYQMLYAGVDYKATETMTFGTIAAMSKADDTPGTVDDDQGIEIDLTFKWKMMDNLEYTGIIGYLSAGDYWKERVGMTTDAEDTMALYHRLELTF